jgi:hypothetical protein
MAQVAIGAGVGAGSAVAGGVAAGVKGTVLAKAMLVNAALGAAIAGLGMALAPDRPKNRRADDVLQTTSLRNVPVPVIFGRGRVAGNVIALGNFWGIKDGIDETRGRRLQVINAVLALGEGPIQATGNFRINGQLPKREAAREKISYIDWYQFIPVLGTSADEIPSIINYPAEPPAEADSFIEDSDYGFTHTIKIPWRYTGKLLLHCVVGETPIIPNVQADVLGPDLTIRRSDDIADVAQPDHVPGTAGYDGYTESFYYTVASSSQLPSPFGIVIVNRTEGDYEHTPPPASVSTDITHAWYLGRHDVVLMQDPADNRTFHFGVAGAAEDDDTWESCQLREDYDNAILASYLDELHGILHTLHDDGTTTYLMRLNLLTGAENRHNVSGFRHGADGDVVCFCYSPDHDIYCIVSDEKLVKIDADTGAVYKESTGLPGPTPLAAFAAGQRVGVVTASGFYYYTAATDTWDGPYGDGDVGTGIENFGGTVAAAWNSWTGHITLLKGSGVCINFMASIAEDERDSSAMGTPEPDDETEALEDGWEDFTPAPATQYVRDWSYRVYDEYSLVALEGRSSLAAALWSSIVHEWNLNSGRWGGGLPDLYVHLSSFESVHSYCVGPVNRRNHSGSEAWWAERYKFDFVLDAETTLSQLVMNQILAACNGWATVIHGKLHVGIHRSAGFSVAHFSEATIEADSCSVQFLDRGSGTNRVRVEFTNVTDEYRNDFSEANDEYRQDVQGRVQSQTVSIRGIGRSTHADIVAKAILDQVGASRRMVSFDTNFRAWMLTPGDPIEVTHAGCGLSYLPMRVMSLREDEDGKIRVEAIDRMKLRDHRQSLDDETPPPGTGDTTTTFCDGDRAMAMPESVSGVAWFNNGSTYPPGQYRLVYALGAYQREEDGSWYVRGFELVTLYDAGAGPVSLGYTPGSTDAYDTAVEAEEANRGAETLIALPAAGPLGIRTVDVGIAAESPNSQPYPLFELCPPTYDWDEAFSWTETFDTMDGSSLRDKGGVQSAWWKTYSYSYQELSHTIGCPTDSEEMRFYATYPCVNMYPRGAVSSTSNYIARLVHVDAPACNDWFEVSADVKLPDASNGGIACTMGIHCKAAADPSATSGVSLVFDRVYFQLGKIESTTWTSLGTYQMSVPLDLDATHHVALQHAGTHLRVYVNGAEILDVTYDPTPFISQNHVGFFMDGESSYGPSGGREQAGFYTFNVRSIVS